MSALQARISLGKETPKLTLLARSKRLSGLLAIVEGIHEHLHLMVTWTVNIESDSTPSNKLSVPLAPNGEPLTATALAIISSYLPTLHQVSNSLWCQWDTISLETANQPKLDVFSLSFEDKISETHVVTEMLLEVLARIFLSLSRLIWKQTPSAGVQMIPALPFDFKSLLRLEQCFPGRYGELFEKAKKKFEGQLPQLENQQ